MAARTAYTFFISLFENDCDRARMTGVLRDMRDAIHEQEIEARESSGSSDVPHVAETSSRDGTDPEDVATG